MKNIAKLFLLAACAGTMGLTSCIDEAETFSSTALEDQLASSSKATEALVYAMPAFFNNFATYSSDMAYDWGYGSFMHMRDVETADLAVVSSGYNWYTSWSEGTYLGPLYVATYLPWAYYYQAIQTTNNTIGALEKNEESLNETQKGYLGAGLAFRALFYLDASQWYEFLPNDVWTANEDGNDVTNLTMPIVTYKTTEAEARKNPRATREEMYEFILADLEKAEGIISGYTRANKTLPDLACVYGLKARLNMWVENYAEAEKWARAAIDQGVNTPLTKEEWLSKTDGFNNSKFNSWMWCSQTGKEDDVVQTGILNWTSWMSNEAQYGYAAAGPYNMIGSELYDKILDTDFRKLSWKAPEGGVLEGQEPVIDAEFAAELPAYSSFKFRPGQGNTEDYTVGSVSAYPVMRIEEMYLIEAEAAAHQDGARGAELLNAFMQNYRCPNYNFKKADSESVVDECFLQKRIELWGEGLIMFDYKRLNKSVDRTLSNNWDAAENYKTNGRPAWMNLCIPQSEVDNNEGLKGLNNPDPSNSYKPVQ